MSGYAIRSVRQCAGVREGGMLARGDQCVTDAHGGWSDLRLERADGGPIRALSTAYDWDVLLFPASSGCGSTRQSEPFRESRTFGERGKGVRQVHKRRGEVGFY